MAARNQRANSMTRAEARRIAANIATLPELLNRVRRCALVAPGH